MKIVHCADFHFNRPFSCFDSERIASVRREEQMDAFRRIARLSSDCDALLIAGDLLDNQRPDYTLMADIIKELKGVPRVFIAPGNHDPHTLYEQFEFPENIHVFKGKTECVDCGEFAVYGNFGCEIGDIELDASKINLLCIHADVNGNGDYNSITESTLCSYGFDYIALGHIHKYSGVKKMGMSRYAYCGTPFAGGFDEKGDKGVMVLDITKGDIVSEFVTTDTRKFREEIVTLDNASGYSDIILSKPCEGDFYKIILRGTTSADFVLRPDVLRERIEQNYYYVRIKDETDVFVSYDAIAEEYSLKGIFVRKMMDRIKNDPENKMLKKALEAGVRVLEGKDAEGLL